MPLFDFKCNKCGYINEYNTNESLPLEFRPPKTCPQCGAVDSLEKVFSAQRQSFDIIGYCYTNEYGKHAWKKNMSVVDQSKVYSGEKNPY
jgi:putative FmdB family regulatory protein